MTVISPWLGSAAAWFDQRHRLIWRILIVALVLALSVGLAYDGSAKTLSAVLFGIPAAMIALVCLRWPSLGPVLIIILGQVAPFSLPTGTYTRLNPVILLTAWLLITWFLRMVVRREAGLYSYPSVSIAILLALAVLVSLLVGQVHWYPISAASLPAQLGGMAVFLISLGAMLSTAHQTQGLIWLQRMTYAVLAIGVLYLASQLAWNISGRYLERFFTDGTLGSIFWVWLVALAAGQLFFNVSLTLAQRAAHLLLIGVTFFLRVVVAGEWASGWMPGILALLVVGWGRYRRLGWFGLMLMIALFLANINGLLVAVAGDGSGNLFPWEARTDAWQVVVKATMANPLFGLGPSNYYHYVRLFPIQGWQQNWYVPFSSHNNYVDIFAQLGLVGLALFVGLMLALGRETWRLRLRVTDGFTRGYIYACLGGLIGSLFAGMLGDWFLPFVYNLGFAGMRSSIILWLFMGGMLVIRRHVDQADAAAALEITD